MFSITPAAENTPGLIRVSGNLTIYEVSQARELLMADMPLPEGEWQLDLSNIHEIDSAGAQLLLAVQRALSSDGKPATVSAASPCACELIELLCLQALYPVSKAQE